MLNVSLENKVLFEKQCVKLKEIVRKPTIKGVLSALLVTKSVLL